MEICFWTANGMLKRNGHSPPRSQTNAQQRRPAWLAGGEWPGRSDFVREVRGVPPAFSVPYRLPWQELSSWWNFQLQLYSKCTQTSVVSYFIQGRHGHRYSSRPMNSLWCAMRSFGVPWGGQSRLHCKENPIYVFPEKKLRGLSSNFHINVFVSDLYNVFPRSVLLFFCSRIGRPIEGIYKLLT